MTRFGETEADDLFRADAEAKGWINYDDLFWLNVAWDPDGCWEWMGSRFPSGYGQPTTGGLAHQKSLEIKLGRPIGENLMALHTCDNKSCVRPDHLYEGTQADNSRDAVERGRTTKGRIRPMEEILRGEDHPHAKLTWEIVLEIRAGYGKGITQQVLANRFDVPQSTVSKIVNEKAWASPGEAGLRAYYKRNGMIQPEVLEKEIPEKEIVGLDWITGGSS